MKKNYSLCFISMLAFMFLTLNSQAQSIGKIGKSFPMVNILKATNSVANVNDTLEPPSFGGALQCDTVPALYYLDAEVPYDSGFAFGNNFYGETECAQKYYASGTVSELLVWIGHKSGTTGTASANLYSINSTTGGPSSTVLGTSNPKTLSSITTTGLTHFVFPAPVTVTSGFAASVVFPTAPGDTVGVVSTELDCSTTDSLSWENVPLFGGWFHTVEAFGVNTDFFIFPVMVLATDVNGNYPVSHGLTLKAVYPNPAQSFTNINYSIDKTSPVSIQIFDVNGKVIQKYSETLAAGDHQLNVSLKDFSVGNYYFTIRTGESVMTSKFSVVK